MVLVVVTISSARGIGVSATANEEDWLPGVGSRVCHDRLIGSNACSLRELSSGFCCVKQYLQALGKNCETCLAWQTIWTVSAPLIYQLERILRGSHSYWIWGETARTFNLSLHHVPSKIFYSARHERLKQAEVSHSNVSRKSKTKRTRTATVSQSCN